MRFSIGKKIGNTYVGTSVKASSVGKAILYFFTWPFILFYYLFVWPFIKLYQHCKQKKRVGYLSGEQIVEINGNKISMSPVQAKSGIPHYQRIAEESSRILQTTKDPDVYFKRYDLAVENFECLIAAYQICGIQNNAGSLLQQLKDNYVMHTNAFIDRYAKSVRRKIYELVSEKGKANKPDAFRNVMLEYQERLTPENLEYLESKYRELQELITSK